MQDVNEDNEYHALKERVKNREVAVMVWGAAASLCALGVAASIFVLAGPAMLIGAIASGIAGAFSAYKSFRAEQDVRFDTAEMAARREAVNLSRALGRSHSPEDVAVGYMAGKHKEHELRRELEEERAGLKARKWAERVTSAVGALGRSI